MSANNDLTRDQLEQLAGVFRAEAIEHVKAIAEVLFSLEEGTDDQQPMLEEAFRQAHSLKGSSATLGFGRVSTLTHRFEDILGLLKNGEKDLTPQIVDAMLEALELMRKAVLSSMPGDEVLTEEEASIITQLAVTVGKTRSSVPGGPPRAPGSASTIPPSAAVPTETNVQARPAAPQKADHGQATTGKAYVRVEQDRIDTVIAQFGELLESSLQFEALGHDLSINKAEATRLAEGLSKFLQHLEGTDVEGEAMELFDSARNLSILLGSSHKKFFQEERQLTKLLQRSQESLREIRMAPISSLHVSIRNQVREISKATGKKVAMELHGGEYAVDRTVLEAIEEPLIHLLRNAIDHGLESPAERRAAGKEETGLITITARHIGDAVELSLSDDGRGINLQKVRDIIARNPEYSQERISDLSPEQLLDFLFESGFSTKGSVTSLSGRGVGLDVVKYSIERLGGEVRLASTPGNGTILTMRLPLEMSTVRCLLFTTGQRTMAFPASNVEKVLVLSPSDIKDLGGGKIVEFADAQVPLISLREMLELQGKEGADAPNQYRFAAIIRFGERRYAFAFEQIQEYAQLVIKPLGDLLERVPNISGVALLGTGHMAIILNPADLIRTAANLTGNAPVVVAAADGKKTITVLVVDDSIATRTLQKTLLESAGYRVLTAADGLKALQVLANNPCDIICSDVQMPNMDGFELTKAVKSRPGLAHIPVILITSLGSKEDISAGMAAGADAHIIKKELTRSELTNTISQLL